ncbi:MAG: tRNA 2-thiouridine(34) synthase MnmA [Chitinophagales bacterium]|nr:tRNA 2-thiouridine(34) synthase MnmA [Chitinophagales bacterium]
MSKRGKVLVAMSGGIDSTVTAILLHEQGYEVVGITMKTWDYASSGGSKKETGCCSLDSINDARQVAVDLGFHHFIIDIREEFGDYVIDNFVDEYLAGRTPNPCVLCNTHIKWEALLKRADQLECEFIATGHYAQVKNSEDRFYIRKGIDEHKDQSYVLWGLSQYCMSRTQFPLGDLRKTEIREMAKEMKLFDLVNKNESYEICFVPDNDYRGFLKRKVEGLEEKVDGGLFVDKDGNILGNHRGYPFYTIGQRRGLGIALGEPYFVTEINPDENLVVLGREPELEKNGMFVRNLNMQKYASVEDAFPAVTKIRYKTPGAESKLFMENDNLIRVEFHAMMNAITPGQSAVFYEGEDVIGGGNIVSSFMINPTQ